MKVIEHFQTPSVGLLIGVDELPEAFGVDYQSVPYKDKRVILTANNEQWHVLGLERFVTASGGVGLRAAFKLKSPPPPPKVGTDLTFDVAYFPTTLSKELAALELADVGITSEEIGDALVDTLIELQKRDLVRCYTNEGYWKTTGAGKEALRRQSV